MSSTDPQYGTEPPTARPEPVAPATAYEGVAAPARGPAAPTNAMAIVSMVSSILGLTLVPIVGSIVGVVTGYVARRQIAETGEQGSGAATAGLVIGWVGVGLLILGILAIVIALIFFAGAVGSTAP